MTEKALSRVVKNPSCATRRRTDRDCKPISLPEEPANQNLSRCVKHRADVTQRPRRKPFFFVLSKTGLWTSLDCRNSHKASRLTSVSQHQEASTFPEESDLVGSTSGSRVRTFPAAKAWTPTLSTSVACVPEYASD